jgi:hypothetical protein
MTRIDLEPLAAKEPSVITRDEYDRDRRQGFTVLEYNPAGEYVSVNPRDRTQTIRRPVPATYVFRCMKCQYDVVDSVYSPDPKTGAPRTGIDLMRLHVYRNEHPWAYPEFTTPYGNTSDVRIEGVDDYTKEVATT